MTGRPFDSDPFPSATDQDGPSEMSIADLFALPESSRQVVLWLVRQGAASAEQIEAALGLDEQTDIRLATVLDELVQQGYLKITTTSDPDQPLYYADAELLNRDSSSIVTINSAPEQPITVILNSSGEDVLTPGAALDLSATITNKGNQSAIIDIFIDDLPPALYAWCESTQERLALSPGQSGEVVFRFQVPIDALPGTHRYWLTVDAPRHYPNYPPLRYAQILQVLPPVESEIQVSDPTFALQPTTTAAQPLSLLPGTLQQFQVMVYNRGDRVDRFRLRCHDLPTDWFSITYPEGAQDVGLSLPEEFLDLNPGARGIILLMITPPAEAIAGSYIATLRLLSENNPDLALLDLLYLDIQPIYQVDLSFRTIISRVQTNAGLFSVQATNQGNIPRHLLIAVMYLDGGDQCEYSLEPPELHLSPRQTLTSEIYVQPKKRWKRPLFGGGRLLNFGVQVTDADGRALPDIPMQGYIVWESRPWWQILPLILLAILSLATLVWLIWWFLLRPPPSPAIIRFAPEDTEYAVADGDAVRLGFQVSYPKRIQALEIVGQSAEGKVISGPLTYEFDRGQIPTALEPFCSRQDRLLTCRNLRTDARRAGDYTFVLTLIPEPSRWGGQPQQQQTPVVTILPVPLPEILAFQSTQPSYPAAPPAPLPGTNVATPNTRNSTAGNAGSGENSGNANNSANAQTPAARPADDGNPFTPEKLSVNPATDPYTVRLNWVLSQPEQIRAIQIVGKNAEGATVLPPVQINLREGLPEMLEPFCEIEVNLICRNIPTAARQAGDYIFELTLIPKSGIPETPIVQATDPVKIVPRPPRILSFQLNGETARTKYVIPVDQGQPLPNLMLSWAIEPNPGTTAQLQPAPGTVPLQGTIPLPLSPQPGTTVVSLQVSNAAGEQVVRSVTIETFDPTPEEPDTVVVGGENDAAGGANGAAGANGGTGANGGAGGLDAPRPSIEDQLSPQEVPPQFD